jgi:hypothetical protein
MAARRGLAPRKVIPVHLDDYDRFKSPLEDFKRAASAAGLTSQLMYLERGEGTSLIELSIG